VSHTTHDRRDLALARALAEGLRLRGADVWIAPETIPYGATWEAELTQNINKATHFVVILSAASIASDWVQKEIELARRRYEQGTNPTLQIFPLIVGNIATFPNKDFLDRFQQFDYSDDLRVQINQIAAALGLPSISWTDYVRQILAEFSTASSILDQTIALDELTPIRLSHIRDIPGSENPIEVKSLESLLRETSAVLLVGPGGSGKTTALQWLAYKTAEEAIQSTGQATVASTPIFIDLSQYKGELLKLIQRALVSRGLSLEEPELRSELKEGHVLLLLDGFDEVDDRRQLLSDLDQLCSHGNGTRVILTSRPVSGLNATAFARFKRFHIDPLDDEQIRKILVFRLGQAKAGALLQLLEERRVLEAFRQPLMVWFVSIAYLESKVPSVPISKGALYDKVTNYFLEQWEAKRYEKLVSDDTQVKVAILNRLGREMVSLGATHLPEGRVREVCKEETKQQGLSFSEQAHLLEELFSTGLVKKSGEGAAFAHLTLRDFFAAKWLREHFSLSEAIGLSWQSKWHEALVHLTGLLSDSQGRRWLSWLTHVSRLTTPVARFDSYMAPANQILLTLNCLGNANEAYDDLKDRFLALLKGRQPFLAKTTVPVDLTFPLGINDVYAYFCALVGRLRRPLSLEVLNEVKNEQSRICGLAQFWDIDLLLREFQSSEHRDGVADIMAAYFIFRFPAQTVVEAIKQFLDRHDSQQNLRLIEAVNLCLASSYEASNERYPGFDQEETGWIQMLTRIAIYDENESIRNATFSIIRAFGRNKASLPELAERSMMEVVRDGAAEDVRARAIWYLVYGQTLASFELLKALIDDHSLDLRMVALDALRIRDRQNFPTYMAHILKRFFGADHELSDNIKQIGTLVKLKGCNEDVAQAIETIEYLVAGALEPKWYWYRKFSVEALFLTKLREIEPLLVWIMVNDENEEVREKALWGLSYVLETDVEPQVYRALDDPSSAVRGAAVDILHYRLPQEVRLKAIAKLEKLAKTDPDAEVQKRARWAVKTIKGEPHV